MSIILGLTSQNFPQLYGIQNYKPALKSTIFLNEGKVVKFLQDRRFRNAERPFYAVTRYKLADLPDIRVLNHQYKAKERFRLADAERIYGKIMAEILMPERGFLPYGPNRLYLVESVPGLRKSSLSQNMTFNFPATNSNPIFVFTVS